MSRSRSRSDSTSPRRESHKKSRNESPQRETELLIEGNEKDVGDSFKTEIEEAQKAIEFEKELERKNVELELMQRKWNERKFILEKQLHSQLIEESKSRIEQATKRIVTEYLQDPDFLSELNEKIALEQAQMKDFFGNHTLGLKELVLEFVKDQQNHDVTEKIKAKEQLEIILEQNNKLIAQQQEKAVVSSKSERKSD